MYDEKVTYRVGINWKDILLKIILLILFILLLLWLFPKPKLDTFYDSVFNNNIQTMKDAAADYYTVDRLPENVGDTSTMTLGEMLSNKLIIKFVDKDNKTCDNNASFVQVTKTSDSEYALKVQLTCGEQSDYILTTIGCHNVCKNGECQTVIEKPVAVEEPVVEEPYETAKVIEYQFKKEIKSTKTVYSCPDGYTLNGSVCKKSVVGETINATTDYFQDTKLTRDADKNTTGSYIVYADPNKKQTNVTYTCPTGYNLKGTACVKTTSPTYKEGEVTYSCPTGYTKIGTTCYQTIPATPSTGQGSYTCPSGYTLNGTTCYRSYSATYNPGTSSYSCPSGYTLSGTTCYKRYSASKNTGETTYTCPSGYTLSGTTCYKTYNATKKEGTTTYTCPSGYTKTGSGSSTKCYKTTKPTSSTTYGSWYVVKNYYQTTTKSVYSNDTEKLVYNGSSYDYSCSDHSKCPVKVKYYSYTLYRRSSSTTYTCPSGYTKSGSGSSTTCTMYANPNKSTTQPTYSCPNGGVLNGTTCKLTQSATKHTGTTTYYCPNGGSLSGTTCTLSETATGSTGQGSYSCPNGGSLSGTTCTLSQSATYNSGTTSYTCPSEYTKIGTTCTIYINATPNAGAGSYSCPSGYTLDGSTCYAYAQSTPHYEYEYSCPEGYTKEGEGDKTVCKKTITGTTTYYCKNSNETLEGDKCVSTQKGGIKGYSCPSGYSLNGTVCVSYTTETINAESSEKETSSYEYKWSEYSSLEGWTPTGKTREIEKEIASIK